jgi:hypothetical protein
VKLTVAVVAVVVPEPPVVVVVRVLAVPPMAVMPVVLAELILEVRQETAQ